MLVQLAYPHEGHEPDEVIEVDADTGRDMVRDGLARLPDLAGLRKAELEELARAEGVAVPAGARKADVEAALVDAGHAAPSGLGPTDEGAPDGR